MSSLGQQLSKKKLPNRLFLCCVVEAGTMLGEASSVTVVQLDQSLSEMVTAQNNPRGTQPVVNRVAKSNPIQRKQALKELVDTELLTPEQTQELQRFLGEYHEAYCIETTERGETDIDAMEINTSDARPKKQPPRQMLFAVRTEVAKQLRTMQDAGVIQPSTSPWATPVVVVRKQDGTHRFCVDYRELNSVTKPDTFPLLRVDDLLDQPGASCYFKYLGPGVWVLAGTHASKLSGEDCVCHTPGIIRIPSHAIWANQCTHSLSTTHGEGFGRTEA